MKEIILRSFLTLLIILVLIPGFKLIYILIKAYPKSYTLELDTYEKVITRYQFDKDALSSYAGDLPSSKNAFGEKALGGQSLDQYYTSLLEQYKIEEDLADLENFYNRSLNLQHNKELGQMSHSIVETMMGPVLGEKDKDVIGDLSQFKILHNFDDTGLDDLKKQIAGTEPDNIAKKMDAEGQTIDSYVKEKITHSYRRSPDSFKVYAQHNFFTSPSPDHLKKNSVNQLSQLRLLVSKKKYYSFEIIRYNLVSKEAVNLEDLKIYVVRDGYIFPNVGGKIDYFFKYNAKVIHGTAALGYNPPPGKYQILVKSKSNPHWPGLSTDFDLLKRKPPKLKPGFSVVNLEYTVPVNTRKIIGPSGKLGNYEEMANWVKYMDADAFWMLAAQTTGWGTTIKPDAPWIPGGFKNLNLLAPEMKKRHIEVGAYVMSYFTPANGKAKVGYEPSLGYDPQLNKLENTYHISLNCERRFQDIVKVARTLERDTNIDYIGLDFIRTGRADGYEMGPLVVRDMNIRVPKKYEKYSYIDKVKWFARQIESKKNQVIIKKWRWWRATKTASIVNKLITEGEISKPIWVFTLGWEHGKQHGQDPYMMFDAGAMVDAIMLYEATELQFKNMMVQWNNYMRNNENNIVIGNSPDIRLLDSTTRNTPVEFEYRQKKGYRNVYRNGLAKGIFFHDLYRALWSSKRGITTLEWAVVNGHTISAFRHESGIIPYEAKVSFNKDQRTAVIQIENKGQQAIHGIKLHFVPTYSWQEVKDNAPASIDLRAGEKRKFLVEAMVREGYESKDSILGYYLEHPRYRRYFFYTQKTKKRFKQDYYVDARN